MKSVFCLSSASALLLLPLVAPADEKSHWKAVRSLPRLMAKGAQISRRRVEDNIDELGQLLALKASETEETTEDK